MWRLITPAHPLQLALGLIIWSMWFVLVYAALSLGCAFAVPENALSPFNWLNGLLLVITLVTTLCLAFFAVRYWRVPAPTGNARFIARVAAAVYLAAAIATLAVGLPILVLPPCL